MTCLTVFFWNLKNRILVVQESQEMCDSFVQVEDVHHWDLRMRETSHLQVSVALSVHLSGMKHATVPFAAGVWCGDPHPVGAKSHLICQRRVC